MEKLVHAYDVEPSAAIKRRVTVHVTFIKIGEIHTLKEAYDADILIRSKWREPILDKSPDDPAVLPAKVDWTKLWNPMIYIDNAFGEPKVNASNLVEYTVNGEATVIERRRYKGTFIEPMELWEFPFDIQDLSLTLMSEKNSDEVELLEDPDEIHKIFRRSFVDEQEFYLYKYIQSESKELQKDRADPFVRRSALHVQCRAARIPWYFVWNHFAVTLLICCLSFVTFAIDQSRPQNRLQLSFTLILTCVAFKFVVGQNLPKISYLTYLDRYVLATIVCVSCVTFWHGLTTLIPVDKYPDKEYIALAIFIGCYLIYNIQFFMRLLLVPLRSRRRMVEAEKRYTARVKKDAQRKHTTRDERDQDPEAGKVF